MLHRGLQGDLGKVLGRFALVIGLFSGWAMGADSAARKYYQYHFPLPSAACGPKAAFVGRGVYEPEGK